MISNLLNVLSIFLLLSHISAAQYFPPEPTGITKLRSKIHPGATISYKKTNVCETTVGVNSYSGYILLPPSDIFPHPINTFFLFFEARNSPSTAPLAIWIGGGPGESAITGATSENGPCYVNADGNSTRINNWSRSNYVNMLYIDQPVDAGYSYNRLVNGSIDQITGEITPRDFSKGLPFEANYTVGIGTFSDQRPKWTLNSSDTAAKVMWSFTQIWVNEFPKYKTSNQKLSLWTNSYGGYFGTAIIAYFQSQNLKILSGTIPTCEGTFLHLDTLGIENGCIDIVSQGSSYAQYFYNNTYGLQMISKDVFDQANQLFYGPGGCVENTLKCRAAAVTGDPNDFGNNKTVNKICLQTVESCFPLLYLNDYSGRSAFDISHLLPDPFPYAYPLSYFNQRWVQQDLGVPVNFSYDPIVIQNNFISGTADPARQDISHLNFVLQSGIKVAMIYGDRDSRCNWIGAENVSLVANYPSASAFRVAGYENITTNASYTGGVVRQYNGFSFSRVFEAGHTAIDFLTLTTHSISAFQPETAYQIFMRAMFDTDVATGKTATNNPHKPYSSEGPPSSWHIKSVLPPAPPTVCDVWAISQTCSQSQIETLRNGTAVVKKWIVVDAAE